MDSQKSARHFALVLFFYAAYLLSYVTINIQEPMYTSIFWSTLERNNISVTESSNISRPVERPVISNNTDELEIVLAKASMPNKTLILTAANSADMEPNGLVDLLLASFRIGEETQSLLDYLLIVALDEKAFKRCKEIHPHCYDLRTEGVDFSGKNSSMKEDYLKITRRRLEFLKDVLEHGFSFVFTDTDVLWFRNPFRRLSPEADFQISCGTCDYHPSDPGNITNGGFLFVRSNQETIKLYNLWYHFTTLYPGKLDQDVFNEMKVSKEFTEIGLKLLLLDMANFSGFCDIRSTPETSCTMEANCCVGIRTKMHDLREALEDWMLFRLDVGRRSEMKWRSRDECKRSREKDVISS